MYLISMRPSENVYDAGSGAASAAHTGYTLRMANGNDMRRGVLRRAKRPARAALPIRDGALTRDFAKKPGE